MKMRVTVEALRGEVAVAARISGAHKFALDEARAFSHAVIMASKESTFLFYNVDGILSRFSCFNVAGRAS